MSKKLSDLPQLTTPHNNDKLLIDDSTAGSTKYILVSDLMQLIGLAPNNAVTANMLATNAITLGYAQATTNQAFTSATAVQITGLTVTCTIPAGGRRVKITAFMGQPANSASAFNQITLWDGAVGSGTNLQNAALSNSAGFNFPLGLTAVITPAAGTKTYNIGLSTTSGTLNTSASPTSPIFLLVETI